MQIKTQSIYNNEGNSNKKKYIIYLLFFMFGTGIFKIYIPFFFIYIVFSLKNYIYSIYDKKFKTIYGLLNVYILLFFLIGLKNADELDINQFYIYIFVSGCIFLIAYIEGRRYYKEIIGTYLLGSFFYVMFYVFYNLKYSGSVSIYGNMIDPLTTEAVNTPQYANLLSIVVCGMIIFLNEAKIFILRVISIIMIGLTIFSGLYLGARAFFVVLFIFLFIYLSKKIKIKNVIIFLFVVMVSSIIVKEYFDIIAPYVDFILFRFQEEKIDTTRYLIWKESINEILNYPFGGFPITASNDSYWCHNLWLDVARISGWIPLMLLISLNIFFLLQYNELKNKKSYFNIWLIGVISLGVMFQEVEVTRSPIVFFGYLTITSVLLSRFQNKYYVV